jgi:hypothetical protein
MRPNKSFKPTFTPPFLLRCGAGLSSALGGKRENQGGS